MKKLILSAAILLGSLSTFAQTTPEEGTATEKATTTTEATTTEAAATSQEATATAATTDGYTEIKPEELPSAVTESLKKSFPDAKLNKVSINDKKEYKLDVEVGTRAGALYAEETGKWIQK